jgi:type VI protein secretion system component VasK
VPRAAAADIDAGTRLGEVYVASLLRAQLGLALRVLAVLVIGVAGLPLLFHLLPGLAGVSVLGLPLAWVLLGGLVYPFLVLLGWWYVRRAEQHEEDFAELLSRPDPDEEAGS